MSLCMYVFYFHFESIVVYFESMVVCLGSIVVYFRICLPVTALKSADNNIIVNNN